MHSVSLLRARPAHVVAGAGHGRARPARDTRPTATATPRSTTRRRLVLSGHPLGGRGPAGAVGVRRAGRRRLPAAPTGRGGAARSSRWPSRSGAHRPAQRGQPRPAHADRLGQGGGVEPARRRRHVVRRRPRASCWPAPTTPLDRLTDLVTNLLDLSRLQAGVLPVLSVAGRAGRRRRPRARPRRRRRMRRSTSTCPTDLPEVERRRRAARAGDRQPGAERAALLAARARRCGSPAARTPAWSSCASSTAARASPRPTAERCSPRSSAWTTRRPPAPASGSAWRSRAGSPRRWAGTVSPRRRPAAARRSSSSWPWPRGVTPKVLIVEDERPLLRALAMNLTARGYEVTEAETGDQGAERRGDRRARRDRARPRPARHLRAWT